MAPLFLMQALLFGGFFINSSSYPGFLVWAKYTSPIFFADSAILVAQWTNGPEEGQQALQYFVGNIGYWNCIYCLMLMIFFWRTAAYLMLRWNVEKFQ